MEWILVALVVSALGLAAFAVASLRESSSAMRAAAGEMAALRLALDNGERRYEMFPPAIRKSPSSKRKRSIPNPETR